MKWKICEDVAARIRGFLDMQTPQGLFDKLKMLPKLAELGSFFPKSVKDGACKEVVRKGNDVNLLDFPILKCWPQDGGRFITFPLVFTKNPETGKRNVGMYRMQVYDERTTGMHWQTQKHGAEHFRRARAKNPEGRIPVSVAIGADPATTLGGILPIPPDLDEMMFSGFLKREPVELVTCETNESGSAGERGDRAGRLRQPERDAHGRAVRRSHGILFAGRGVPGVPRGVRDAPQGSDLSDHRGGAAAAGRFLHGVCDRAGVPAADEDARIRRLWTCRCPRKALCTI